MLITLLCPGSRGDVQPYLALGLALKKRGLRVRVATFTIFETFIQQLGLEYFHLSGDISQVASSEMGKEAMQADNPLKLLLSFNALKSKIFDLQNELFDACRGADAIVYHPGASIGYFAAQEFKVPAILATPFPMTPTREYPALIFYNSTRLGRMANFVTHKIFEQVMWMASGSPVKDFWKKEFGHAPARFGCPFGKQNSRRFPTIISCSDFVFPRPVDWPEHVHNTGYWFLEDEPSWKPSQELLNFLDQGPAPVYVGFGSVGDPALADQTTRIVIEALRRSGRRGILATGWSGMSNLASIPEGIFILESAPHSWLFPRMAAVVHHGGAGTSAAGFKAGVPQVVVPGGNDQFAWGLRVHELGAGSKPVPRKSLTGSKLSAAIDFALTEQVINAASELGRKVQSENGAETAAGIIMDCFPSHDDTPLGENSRPAAK
jgi:sterol 3beta-glucosyltransferase